MKKLIFGAALSALTIIGALPARASGCYPPLAASVLADSIRGGLSPSQAVQQASSEGYVNSESCLARTIGYMRSLPTIYGDVLR